MNIKLTLKFDEVLEKFLPNLPPETGVSIEIEEPGAEPTPLPPLAIDEEKMTGHDELLDELKEIIHVEFDEKHNTRYIAIDNITDGCTYFDDIMRWLTEEKK